MRRPIALVLAWAICLALAGTASALTPTRTATPTRTPSGGTATPTPTPTQVPGEILFNAGPIYSVPGAVQFFASADFDRDGNPDLAFTSNPDNTVTVMLGDGTGGFPHSRPTGVLGRGLRGLVAGDLNGDDIPDVAVSASGLGRGVNSTLVVLLGQGDGSLGEPSSFRSGKGPYGIVMGDFDGQNGNDLAQANSQGATASVFLNLGQRAVNFSPLSEYPSRAPFLIAQGDFNNDGAGDLVTLNRDNTGASSITLFTGDGLGSFQSRGNFGVGNYAQQMATGDFDSDGVPDIAVTNSRLTSTGAAISQVTVLISDGAGSFAAAEPVQVNCDELGGPLCAPGPIVTGDFDGDGITDIAVAVNIPNVLVVYPGNGDGSFGPASPPQSIGFPTAALLVADFDGDQRPDLAVGGGIQVQVFQNLTIPVPTPTPTSAAAASLTAARSPSPTPKPNGASCHSGAECFSGICTNGVCSSTLKPNGASCDRGAECVSGTCTNGVCSSGPVSSIGRSGGGCSAVGAGAAPFSPIAVMALPAWVWMRRRRGSQRSARRRRDWVGNTNDN